MRKLLLIIALAATTGISAQTVTVSATHFGGTAPATGTIYWRPVDAHGVPLSYQLGSGGQVPNTAQTAAVTSGAFSLTLPDTDVTNPQHVCFLVTFEPKYGGTQSLGPGYSCVQPAADNSWCTAGACNFDSYIPTTAALALVQPYVASVNGVSGDLTLLGCTQSGSTFTCGDGGGSGSPGGANYSVQYGLNGAFAGASFNGLLWGSTTGAPAAATSSQVQSVIGSSVYDAYGAAAARAGTGNCTAGQYQSGSATTGPTCAQVQYTQITGTPAIPTSASWPNQGSCTAGYYMITLANGSAPTCAQVQYTQLGGTVPIWNQDTTGTAAKATQLAAVPTQCAGGQFAIGIAASGNANCATPGGGGNVSGSGTSTIGNFPAESNTSSTAIVDSGYGPSSFDAAGAAAARAATGTCGAGQYETGDGTSGPTCAQVQYSQVTGTPSQSATVNGQTCTLGASCNGNYTTGTLTGGHFAAFSGTGSQVQDSGYGASSFLAASTQLPQTIAAAAHKWINSYSASTGQFTQTQPACGDLSDAAASCNTDTTNASNIASGNLGAARLPSGILSCTEVWGGSGTSSALQSGDDAISNNTCYNDSGATRTITAVKCRSDNASNTTTVNPTFGSSGTGTTILSGALTCGSSYAWSSSGTVSNASWTTGKGVDPGMSGTLTGTSIALIIEYHY